MAINLDLTVTTPRAMVIQGVDEDGDEFRVRVEFKKILTRQQALTMTRTIGKGKKAKEVPDLQRLYSHTIKSLELGGTAFQTERFPIDEVILEQETILALMDSLPSDVTNEIDSYILNASSLEVEAKNS